MEEARRTKSSTEVRKDQRTSALEFRKGPRSGEVSRLLNLREAMRYFGLTDYQIYAAVHRGLLHAVQVGGRGRIYYPEWELVSLTNTYGLEAA